MEVMCRMNQELGTIISRIDHQFYLPPDIHQSLDKYYILHWQGSYLLSQLSDPESPEDIIIHQDTRYRARFIPPLSAWELLTNPKAQYKLSFRKLPKKATGFVLIKKA